MPGQLQQFSAPVAYILGHVSSTTRRPHRGIFGFRPTFWKETAVAIDQMFPQEPTISELIVTLKQLDAVPFCQAQLIGTACLEVV